MAYTATVLRVLIASPGNVEQERKSIPDVLRRWNVEHAESKGIVLLPVGWETDTYALYEKDKRPQAIINDQIANTCDIVIGVFGSRLGSSTGEYDSGTVEEIETSVNTGKPVAVYFSLKHVEPIDIDQLRKVHEYKSYIQTKGALTRDFGDINEFRELVRDHLSGLVTKAMQRIDSVKNADVTPVFDYLPNWQAINIP